MTRKVLMNRSGLWMVLVLFLLMGGTAGACWYFKTHQVMGEPGVRIVAGELYNEKGELVRTNRVDLPEDIDQIKSMPWPITIQELDWLPPDTTYGRRRYLAPGGHFLSDLNVVVMGKDRTSIHKPQYCLPSGGFEISSEETITLPITLKDGSEQKAQLIRAGRTFKNAEGQNQEIGALFFYYFVTDGQTTPDHVDMLWRISRELVLSGKTQRWGYVSMMTLYQPGREEEALEWSKELLKKAVPRFQFSAQP